MTCDDVFDVLTRGPFPSGAPCDDQVEYHLDHCPECRRLALALRPAIELFQEALGSDDRVELLAYNGRADGDEAGSPRFDEDAAALQKADTGASEAERRMLLFGTAASAECPARWHVFRARFTEARGQPSASSITALSEPRTNLMRFAAAVLLGVAAAGATRGLGTLRTTSSDAPDPRLAALHATDSPNESTERRWLAGVTLPAACKPGRNDPREHHAMSAGVSDGLQLAAADAVSRLACCTDCHSSSMHRRLSPDSRSLVARACQACH